MLVIGEIIEAKEIIIRIKIFFFVGQLFGSSFVGGIDTVVSVDSADSVNPSLAESAVKFTFDNVFSIFIFKIR